MRRSIWTVLAFVLCYGMANARTRDDFTGKTSFRCGASVFTATTRVHILDVLRQTMSVQLPSGKMRRLDLREISLVQHAPSYTGRALNASVEGWQCRKTGQRHFVVLMYACNLDMTRAQIARYCPITGEWARYLDIQGRPLDDGYAPEDPRYGALERKLGYPVVGPDQARDDGVLGSIY